MKQYWQKAAEYVGLDISSHQVGQMERFSEWLATEAHTAGGIGPNEIPRIDQRHLADSVLFASAIDSPASVWDLGSGVGLPGVPLAILMPDVEFLLIDRAGRRTDLVSRAVRILEIDNCQVLQAEIGSLEGVTDCVVARASLPPEEMRPVIERLLAPGGTAVLGGSWKERPKSPGWSSKEIPHTVLDHTVWLLMMRRP